MAAVLDDPHTVFRALSDPTRCAVVEQLAAGPAPTSTLAAPHDMALPSFTQHLRVLVDAGLITSTKDGRVRTYRLAPARLDAVAEWLATQRRTWERRLDQMDELLLHIHHDTGEPT